MPDQLFTYYIENPLVIMPINSGSWGRIVDIRINIGIWEIGKVGTKREGGKIGGWVGEEVWGLLGFVALVLIWVYFCCCGGGSLYQGLQGAGVV
jgi:hypothetical protein